jgi:hypothetical protein
MYLGEHVRTIVIEPLEEMLDDRSDEPQPSEAQGDALHLVQTADPTRWRMRRFPCRAPDAISPIVAYRVWVYAFDDLLGALFPIIGAGGRDTSWSDAGKRWVDASCHWVPSRGAHRPPDERCTCGFHAVKSIDAAWSVLPGGGRDLVIGRVQLAGKVIEYEHGYRAERARIVELFPWRGSEAVVERLASCVGVPVGRSLPPLDMGAPDRGPSSPQRPLRGWVRAPLVDCVAGAAMRQSAWPEPGRELRFDHRALRAYGDGPPKPGDGMVVLGLVVAGLSVAALIVFGAFSDE